MADDEGLVNQDDIEKLLQQGGGADKTSKPPPAAKGKAEEKKDESSGGTLDQSAIEAMLNGQGNEGQSPQSPQTPKTPEATQSPAAAPTATASPPAADDDKTLGQNDIEKLLQQAGGSVEAGSPGQKQQQPAVTQAASNPLAGEGDMMQGDIEYLLNQAEQALESIDAPSDSTPPTGVSHFRLTNFAGATASTNSATLDLIRDVDLDVKIELGRTHMYLEDVLKLAKGSVVPLDKLAGDPVDIYVNGRLIARGEILVLNDNFCVRVAELIAGARAG